MGMNVNLGTGVNSYSTKSLPTTAPGYTSQVQANLLSQPAYDTVSFSGNAGNYQTQNDEKQGMSTGAKVGLVAAAAALVVGGIAISRGKKLNGDSAKLWDNLKTGVKSMFTKAGRELYKTNVTDKLDDAAASALKKVSGSNVTDAAKGSVSARETLAGLKKEQAELAKKVADATGDEATALQKQLDGLTQKITDAENPTSLMQQISAGKKAGQDVTELQKRLDNIADINVQAADKKTASLMARQSLQNNETYTKAIADATELKGKLTALETQQTTLSTQVQEKEGLLAQIKASIKQARKTGQNEALTQLTKQQTEVEKALTPLRTQLDTLRGSGEGSISAAKKALTDVSVPAGDMLTQARNKYLAELQQDNSSVTALLQSLFGSK